MFFEESHCLLLQPLGCSNICTSYFTARIKLLFNCNFPNGILLAIHIRTHTRTHKQSYFIGIIKRTSNKTNDRRTIFECVPMQTCFVPHRKKSIFYTREFWEIPATIIHSELVKIVLVNCVWIQLTFNRSLMRGCWKSICMAFGIVFVVFNLRYYLISVKYFAVAVNLFDRDF